MNRPAPRIVLSSISIGGQLEPSGAHLMVVEGPASMVAMKFTVEQIDVLERGIAAFRTLVVTTDAGPDLRRQIYKPLAAG